jgi:hypothetical protein
MVNPAEWLAGRSELSSSCEQEEEEERRRRRRTED